MRLFFTCVFLLLSVSSANALTIASLRTSGGPIGWFCLFAWPTVGSGIIIHTCDHPDNQQWLWDHAGRILFRYDGMFDNPLCLDVQGGEARAGNWVQIWPCNGTAAQTFYFAGGGIRFGTSYMCLDVPRNNKYDGAPIQIWPCNYTMAQRWNLDALEISYYSTLMDPGFCLKPATFAVGSRITLQPCDAAASQWVWYDTDVVKWAHPADTLCLDVPGSVARAGNYVQLGYVEDRRHRRSGSDGTAKFNSLDLTYVWICLEIRGILVPQSKYGGVIIQRPKGGSYVSCFSLFYNRGSDGTAVSCQSAPPDFHNAGSPLLAGAG